MVQHETPLSEQRVQAIWDRLEGATDDRRRPGRSDHVNLNLIPLLRGEVAPTPQASYETDLIYGRENSKRAFGIVAGLVLNMPLWGVIGFAGWILLR